MKKKWKALTLAGIVGILTVLWLGGVWEPKRPNLYATLELLPGFDIKQVQGEYLIVHFWAKWCEPCADEIPHLVEFSAQTQTQFKKPLKILAISLDPTLEESKEILPDKGTKLPPNFILALDPNHLVAEKLGSFQYPETYFVSPKGEILEKWVGPQKWNKAEVVDFFKQKVM